MIRAEVVAHSLELPYKPGRQNAKNRIPIYDKSYVAKWIFQVMGLEIDEAWKFIEELRFQAFQNGHRE